MWCCCDEEGTEWEKKAGGRSIADAPLGSGLPSRERTDGNERRLVSRKAAWPFFSYFGDDVKLADKISQPQVQVLSMDISRNAFLKFRTQEVENALNIATLVLRLLVHVAK